MTMRDFDLAWPTTAAAAERAARWICQAWTQRDEDDAGLAVDVLALGQLCRVLGLTSAAKEIEEQVASTVPEPAWAASNLLTALLAAVGAVGQATAFSLSARRYLDVVGEIPADDIGGANAMLVHLALQRVRGPERVRVAVPARHLSLGKTEQIQQFLSRIEIASGFGTFAVAADAATPILLEGAAIAAFRLYDLPLGMRLLRARRYLGGVASYGTSTGFDFLRLCQCEDGSFGDYDTALAAMAVRGRRDDRLRLKLPVTFQALWTMAELEDPHFALVRSVFHREHEQRHIASVRC